MDPGWLKALGNSETLLVDSHANGFIMVECWDPVPGEEDCDESLRSYSYTRVLTKFVRVIKLPEGYDPSALPDSRLD